MSVQTRIRTPGDAVAPLEENLWSMWSQFGRGPGCALHESDEALWFETPIPTPPYNMVIRYRGRADSNAPIDAIFAHFKARGVPFLWLVHPSATPEDLPARLGARGLEEAEEITGMTADLRDLPAQPLAPAGVELHEVTPDHDFAPFMDYVAKRWHVPESSRADLLAIGAATHIGAPGSPNRAWIAVKDGVALAKAFTHDRRESVGLYGMATLPEARGQGLARLVCIAALSDARRRGHRHAVLHSTPMAKPLYAAVGFRAVARFHLFAAPRSFYA